MDFFVRFSDFAVSDFKITTKNTVHVLCIGRLDMDAVEFHLYRSVAKNVQRLRERRRMTQDQFASFCEISRGQLLRVESGRGEMRILTLSKIAYRCSIRLSELFQENRAPWVEVLPVEKVHKADEVELRFHGHTGLRGKVLTFKKRKTAKFRGEENLIWYVRVESGKVVLQSPLDRDVLEAGRMVLVRGTAEFRFLNPFEQTAEVCVIRLVR